MILFVLVHVLSIVCTSANYMKESTIKDIRPSPETVTITSFHYNPTSAYSSWVDRIFGSKSIFHTETFVESFFDESVMSLNEQQKIFQSVSEVFELPANALWPSCSIEMLGYVVLGKASPFLTYNRAKPVFGAAIIYLGNDTFRESWDCFYRPLFENWREERKCTAPNFWSIVYYCPSRPSQNQDESCRAFERFTTGKTAIIVNVTTILRSTSWNVSFEVNIPQKDISIDRVTSTIDDQKLRLAVCTVIPYTSTDTDKSIANGAMLVEWVRYHTKLGMKVIVYDREGSNNHHIFNSSYAKSHGITRLHFVYHNYTIRGLLDSAKKGIRYDNTEGEYSNPADELSRLSRFESQGHDKTLTFTQCRFEAKALYGLDSVLISDFDEFFYCSAADADFQSQRKYLRRYLEYHRHMGREQLMFPQRLVLPKTLATPLPKNFVRDCLVNNSRNGLSIFECFSAFEYFAGGHSVKSLHLAHVCPLTGYHHSCSDNIVRRYYNCLCNNKVILQNPWRPFRHLQDRECALLHLSSKSEAYADQVETEYSPAERAAALRKPSELWTMAQSDYHAPPTS